MQAALHNTRICHHCCHTLSLPPVPCLCCGRGELARTAGPCVALSRWRCCLSLAARAFSVTRGCCQSGGPRQLLQAFADCLPARLSLQLRPPALSQVGDSPFVLRTSPLSDAALGFSLGYFSTDLLLLVLYYPSFGGPEMAVHHLAALASVAAAAFQASPAGAVSVPDSWAACMLGYTGVTLAAASLGSGAHRNPTTRCRGRRTPTRWHCWPQSAPRPL